MGFDSKNYWENRYKNSGTSGLGSYGDDSIFKTEYINALIYEKNIKTINDLGCGDGNQISMFTGFNSYVGFDVSKTTVQKCITKFNDNKKYNFVYDVADMKISELTLSLDVTYHIIEDEYFIEHIQNLFKYSNCYVLIYSVNGNIESSAQHIKHRNFVEWIEDNIDNVKLIDVKKQKKHNGVGFYLFKKI